MKKSAIIPIQDEHGLSPFRPGSLDKNLELISEYGYEGVELGITDPGSVSVEEVSQKLTFYDLELSAITTGQAYGLEGISLTERDPTKREIANDRLKGHIDFASNFRGTVVILGSLRGRGESKQALRWLKEKLNELVSYAESKSVDLAFEPLNRYESSIINNVEEGLNLVEEIGSPRLGLLLDTFHANIEEAILEESIKEASKNLFYVHLADSNRWAPGYGHINFVKIFSALAEIEYEGFCSLESLPKPDKSRCLQAMFRL